jgi:polyhydroxybutyrate depolymerase
VAFGAGCGPIKPHASGTTVETITTVDGNRTYRLHVPPGYTGASFVPLVLNFHGLGSNAIQQEGYSGLVPVSDANGFILVSPDGTTNGFGQQFWNTVLYESAPYDIAFTEAILDELEDELCIDTWRVYSTGMSNGGLMSTRLACSLSSRIAAVAPVAGGYYPALLTAFPNEICPDTRPVPFLDFHGTSDTTVPYYGGAGLGGAQFRLPVDNNTTDEDIMEDWAAHNNCTSGRQESQYTTNVRLIEYTGCDDDADATHYAIDGGGHTWPGSFNGTQEISAASLMWTFFQAHPLPNQPPSDIDGDMIPDASDPDIDGDNCPNVNEEQTAMGSEMTGGRRNTKNPWDYFNSTQDGVNRIDDITAVVDKYGHDEGSAGDYDIRYDRSPFNAGLPWEFDEPDGQIRIFDITAAVKSYGHDCP